MIINKDCEKIVKGEPEIKNMEDRLLEIVHGAKGLLAWYKEMGIESLDISESSLKTVCCWSDDGTRGPSRQEVFPACSGISGGQQTKEPPDLVLNFQGPDNARILFVLDAVVSSGKKADAYCGTAGELLLRIISAMHLAPESVRICVFPRIDDVKEMKSFFQNMMVLRESFRENILVNPPDMICTMGKTALELLLGGDLDIKGLRGMFHDYEGIALMPTLHPIQLIEDGSLKRYVWEDIKKMMERAGL